MNGREVSQGFVTLQEIKENALNCILKFIYYEAIEIENNQFLDVIPAAEYFQLGAMKTSCVKQFRRNFKSTTVREKLLLIDQICQHPEPLFEERVLSNFW